MVECDETRLDVLHLVSWENTRNAIEIDGPTVSVTRAWYGHPSFLWEPDGGRDVTEDARAVLYAGRPLEANFFGFKLGCPESDRRVLIVEIMLVSMTALFGDKSDMIGLHRNPEASLEVSSMIQEPSHVRQASELLRVSYKNFPELSSLTVDQKPSMFKSCPLEVVLHLDCPFDQYNDDALAKQLGSALQTNNVEIKGKENGSLIVYACVYGAAGVQQLGWVQIILLLLVDIIIVALIGVAAGKVGAGVALKTGSPAAKLSLPSAKTAKVLGVGTKTIMGANGKPALLMLGSNSTSSAGSSTGMGLLSSVSSSACSAVANTGNTGTGIALLSSGSSSACSAVANSGNTATGIALLSSVSSSACSAVANSGNTATGLVQVSSSSTGILPAGSANAGTGLVQISSAKVVGTTILRAPALPKLGSGSTSSAGSSTGMGLHALPSSSVSAPNVLKVSGSEGSGLTVQTTHNLETPIQFETYSREVFGRICKNVNKSHGAPIQNIQCNVQSHMHSTKWGASGKCYPDIVAILPDGSKVIADCKFYHGTYLNTTNIDKLLRDVVSEHGDAALFVLNGTNLSDQTRRVLSAHRIGCVYFSGNEVADVSALQEVLDEILNAA